MSVSWKGCHPVSFLSSVLYTFIIGGIFVSLFIFAYDLLFGEKKEKQERKIYKHFRKETIKKIEILEHQPRKFTLYQVITENGKKKVKLKPGYKVVNIVKKKSK